jgi:chromate transporter
MASMAVMTWPLGYVALADVLIVVLALAGGVLRFRLRVNPAWLVLGWALVGLLAVWLGG